MDFSQVLNCHRRPTVLQNWKINGTMNPDYECGSPVQVSPSQFPDISGLLSETASVASWQVVCNMTQSMQAVPSCCVSFSAFFSDSAIPCDTCADIRRRAVPNPLPCADNCGVSTNRFLRSLHLQWKCAARLQQYNIHARPSWIELSSSQNRWFQLNNRLSCSRRSLHRAFKWQPGMRFRPKYCSTERNVHVPLYFLTKLQWSVQQAALFAF
ncbi:hypothetical protein V6N12_022668 [Hibiscus sabdariffa]|uniref:Uncharacterized protein n=1 Tax=Hibiscus sabdariffa TaxID=183260 RepID=A0ABR2FVH2_9ROSI